MNTHQSLQEILTGLGVRSAGLAERAEDWLKPILAGGIRYQKLMDQKNNLFEQYKDRRQAAVYYLIITAILVTLYVLLKKQTGSVSMGAVLVGISLLILGWMIIGLWLSGAGEYRSAEKEMQKFANQWVEQVRAAPGSEEKLVDLHHKIQDCEDLMRKKSGGVLFILREQTLEYLLDAGNDPLQALKRYYSAVESGHFNGIIQGCLLRHPLPYALVHQAAPREFAAFMNACYTKYEENPYGFDGTWVERIFDQVILNAEGG